MLLARSLWLKAVVTLTAIGGFVLLYQPMILDSKYVSYTLSLGRSTVLLTPGARLAFTASAYCKGITTTSGVPAQRGIVAADPQLLPVGSVVQIGSSDGQY